MLTLPRSCKQKEKGKYLSSSMSKGRFKRHRNFTWESRFVTSEARKIKAGVLIERTNKLSRIFDFRDFRRSTRGPLTLFSIVYRMFGRVQQYSSIRSIDIAVCCRHRKCSCVPRKHRSSRRVEDETSSCCRNECRGERSSKMFTTSSLLG